MHLTSLYVPTTWEIYLLSFPDIIRFGMSYVLFLEISTCVLGCWGRGRCLSNHMNDFLTFLTGSACFVDTALWALILLLYVSFDLSLTYITDSWAPLPLM